jgi:RNA polymerase sigma factor (sigma-70 family)
MKARGRFADGFPLIGKKVQDEDLIRQLSDPETRRTAFTQLVSLYQRKVYSIIRKMVISHDDADDLVQEVFVKVWHHVADFKGESRLFTWIYRIAVNESLNFLRKRRRFSLFNNEDNAELVNMLEADTHIDGDEIQMKLQKAILQLPDKQRLVFHLKYFEELSYDQIAAITETSTGSLKASYHHATRKIEEWLEKD